MIPLFLWTIGLRQDPPPDPLVADLVELARLASGHGVLTLNLFRERLVSSGLWCPPLSITAEQLLEQSLTGVKNIYNSINQLIYGNGVL